jgi:hypothetical protein
MVKKSDQKVINAELRISGIFYFPVFVHGIYFMPKTAIKKFPLK